jgi:hypothetical protein
MLLTSHSDKFSGIQDLCINLNHFFIAPSTSEHCLHKNYDKMILEKGFLGRISKTRENGASTIPLQKATDKDGAIWESFWG